MTLLNSRRFLNHKLQYDIFCRHFTITAEEYNRLLQSEIQLNKYKGLCVKKAKEIKHLQDQVYRLKRKELKGSNGLGGDEDEDISLLPDTNVNKKILL